MKTTMVVLFVFCAAGAFGQVAGALSSQPQPVIFSDHPLHAEPHAMATQTPIAGGAAEGYSYEHGEQPLWEFGAISQPIPLGDVARAYRKEKLTGKKAEITLDKQGS
jgi:hypothetical protein